MLLGLSATLVATLCYGLASVFQARGARAASGEGGPRRRRLAAVFRSRWFLLGTALDIAGFVMVVIALRRLPLFVVQAVTGASLAVTALAAMWLLGISLGRRDTAGLFAVCVGLVLLGLGSGPEGHADGGTAFQLGLLAGAVGTVAVGLLLTRGRGTPVAAALGFLAGMGFGVVSLAVRVLSPGTPLGVFTEAAAYALAIGGTAAYLWYALALQRGAMTAVIAAVIVGETVVPGLIGVAVLGDRPRPGYTWAAVAGFVLAVGGTFALARFGELES
ncbi:hypothetical protein GCM10010193_00420 [Kitasatospora atroaurantiaca]|uniref:Magnesium transporter NIPA n=1 Tax=Kitasatospora atroaurantiaca TaxID=285545 RepID=A0A561EKX3_9ACTN|nr:hypothetical protein [Kitasatospora atroaurantiaca]TWE16270.1 hypothetical protein FB465_1247 [Kitasatospora atroaurantiaca]